MNTKENKGFVCDIETGVCSSDTITNQQKSDGIDRVKPSNVKLIYYYDALCGWCYGFSSVMSKINKRYVDRLTIEVISGGLFLGNRVGLLNEVAPYIKAGAYKSVEGRTGVKFGDSFLKDVYGEGKIVLDSLPPAIAMCIVKEKFPEKEFEFAEMLLHAVYFDGINPTNIDEYIKYAEKIGFDKEVFFAKMKDDKYQVLAGKEFKKFKTTHFSGMPTLVLETEGKQVVLTSGYTDFENLKSQLDQFLNNH
jgi:putative protein-disulfide isomerase